MAVIVNDQDQPNDATDVGGHFFSLDGSDSF